jgi:hypothetical protein
VALLHVVLVAAFLIPVCLGVAGFDLAGPQMVLDLQW